MLDRLDRFVDAIWKVPFDVLILEPVAQRTKTFSRKSISDKMDGQNSLLELGFFFCHAMLCQCDERG